MEKKHFLIHFFLEGGSVLNTFLGNSIGYSLIIVLWTFQKKRMLNPQIILVVYFSYFLFFILDMNLAIKMIFLKLNLKPTNEMKFINPITLPWTISVQWMIGNPYK